MSGMIKTGYPSIDKPWLKYYSEKVIDEKMSYGSIYDYLYSNNVNHLDENAITYFGRNITYSQLFHMIDKCADSLFSLGISQGDIVTIQALGIPQVVVLIYALSRIGAIANLVYITLREEELHKVLLDTKSKMYIAIDSILVKNRHAVDETFVEHSICLDVTEEAGALVKASNYISNVTLKNSLKKQKTILSWKGFLQHASSNIAMVESTEANIPVAMVYTGGTTGKSKAVVLTNENLNSIVFQYINAGMGFERGCSFLNVLPPFIAFGLSVGMHLPLCMGVRMVLILDTNPENIGHYFVKYKPNYFVAGAIHAEKIITYPQLQNADMSYLKLIAVGGDVISIELENRVNEFLSVHNLPYKLIIGYGMSELSATVCTALPIANKTGTVGIPLPNVVVKIINPETIKELGYDEEGEVCIQSPTIMKGYYNQSEETKEIIRIHEDGSRWLHTGDIGKIDHDGFLSILGRIKRMIVVVDENIYHKVYPKLIEDVIATHELVCEVAVVAHPIPKRQNELVAFVTLQNSIEGVEQILAQHTAKFLEKWECPVKYNVVEKLPRTLIGKVDFCKLEQMIC